VYGSFPRGLWFREVNNRSPRAVFPAIHPFHLRIDRLDSHFPALRVIRCRSRDCKPFSRQRAFDGVPGPDSTPLQTPLPRERLAVSTAASDNAQRGEMRIQAINAQMERMDSGEYCPRRPIIHFSKPESPREASVHLNSRKANLQVLRDIERRARILL
jgi:hypothetical protein